MNKGPHQVIYLLSCATLVLSAEFVYEFGVDEGPVIYSKDGNISLLQWNTIIDIPVPPSITVTYVKVVVNALSAPKVDYDYLHRKISIKYSWTQVALSSFNVLVKGVPLK